MISEDILFDVKDHMRKYVGNPCTISMKLYVGEDEPYHLGLSMAVWLWDMKFLEQSFLMAISYTPFKDVKNIDAVIFDNVYLKRDCFN